MTSRLTLSIEGKCCYKIATVADKLFCIKTKQEPNRTLNTRWSAKQMDSEPVHVWSLLVIVFLKTRVVFTGG